MCNHAGCGTKEGVGQVSCVQSKLDKKSDALICTYPEADPKTRSARVGRTHGGVKEEGKGS